MKKLLILLFLFSSICLLAQPPNSVLIDPTNAKAEQSTTIPFAAIQVLDVRFDKSNIGCVNEKLSADSYKHNKTTASFPDSLHRHLPRILQMFMHLDKNSRDTLVLLVKQFRLAERLVNGINLKYEPELLLKFSLSAFRLRSAQLTKIFSADNVLVKKFPSDRKPKADLFAELRAAAVLQLLQKIFEGRNWESTSTPFTHSAVEEGIRKRYQLPLLTDTLLRIGIYRTFQEFKQNQPSLTNVQFNKRRDKVIDIIDSTGKSMDRKNVWGVCDGKKQYILFRDDFCELLPSDKSFRFLSYSQAKDLAGFPSYGDQALQQGLLGGLIVKAMENTVNDEYFYLNMDEETVYLEEVFGKLGLKQMDKELLK